MANKKVSEEEKLLTIYLDSMKVLVKRLSKDGYMESTVSNGPCRCYADVLSKLSHLRLDRENLQTTLGIALCFGRMYYHEADVCPTIANNLLIPPPRRLFASSLLTNLHLQHNDLESLKGLEVLANTLRVLCLSHNKISHIEHSSETLVRLTRLGLLDLSHNTIKRIPSDPLPFPSKLAILDLRGNSCNEEDYLDMLLEKLPKLINLNGEDYTDETSDEEKPGPDRPSDDELQSDDKRTAHENIDRTIAITCAGSEAMETTLDDIIERSRIRVEAMLARMSTPRSDVLHFGTSSDKKEDV